MKIVSKLSRKTKIIILFLIVSFFVVIGPSIYNIREPFAMNFGGEWDFIHTAKLVQQYGFKDTYYLSVWEPGIEGEKFVYYTHYPPLSAWMYSLAGKLFGWEYLFQYRVLNIILESIFVFFLLYLVWRLTKKIWIPFAILLFVLDWRYWKALFGSTSIFAISFVSLLFLWYLYLKFFLDKKIDRKKKFFYFSAIGILNFIICLTQFDNWPFLLTVAGLHLIIILIFDRRKEYLKKTGIILGIALMSLFLAIGIRLVINYNYFSSWETVFNDLGSAAGKRSLDCSAEEQILTDENIINYGGLGKCRESRLAILAKENIKNIRIYPPYFKTYFGSNYLIALFLIFVIYRLLKKKIKINSPEVISLIFFLGAVPFSVLLPVMFRQGFAVGSYYIGLMSAFLAFLLYLSKDNKYIIEIAEKLTLRQKNIIILAFFTMFIFSGNKNFMLFSGIRYNENEIIFNKEMREFCDTLPKDDNTIIYTTFEPRYMNYICIEDNIQFIYKESDEICKESELLKKQFVVLKDEEYCNSYGKAIYRLPYNVRVEEYDE